MSKFPPIAKNGPLKITVEGCSGSGKTVLMNKILELLHADNEATPIHTEDGKEFVYVTLPAKQPIAVYITHEPFHLTRMGDLTFTQIGYGEYSHTMEQYIPITTLEGLHLKLGDQIYICDEGVYTLHEVTKFTHRFN